MSIRATELVIRLADEEFADWTATTGRPRALGVTGALRLCLCWLRRNVTFAELGEDFGVGTSTAWWYAHEIAAFLADTLGCQPDELADHVAGKVILVDGTLIPTFHWKHLGKLLRSGKRKQYGVGLQALADLYGRNAGAAGPFPGSWHDKHCYDHADLQAVVDTSNGGVLDAGYQGAAAITPAKKPRGSQLTEKEKHTNTQIAKIRVANEWAIAHLKNWRILASRYRGEISHRLNNAIHAVVGLQTLNDNLPDHHRTLSLARLNKK
ncbi:MAG: transposase [Actinobacteria bacterium]|nr:transposase [Actinomycetota bacterium]